MALFRKKLIEIIDWTDNTNDTLMYKFPDEGNDIKMGAQLIVRESQVAIFSKNGQIADIFGPGRHTLTSANIPLLCKLVNIPFGGESPFKAEVYFVSTKQFINQEWGTANPVMMRDSDFGVVRVRGFGGYAFKINEPSIFLKEVFGTHSSYKVKDLNGYLKKIVVSSLSDAIAESKIPALDLSMNYDELGTLMVDKLTPSFNKYGLQVSSFYIENLSVPKEVEEAMDKRTSMGVVGNLDNYAKFQAADSFKDFANNPGGGGAAGAGVGMAAGMQMAQMFNNSGNNSNNSNNTQSNQKPCPKCNDMNDVNAKFCDNCGNDLRSAGTVPCVNCGHPLAAGSKFCGDCGTKQATNCPSCNSKLSPGSKFCGDCGHKL